MNPAPETKVRQAREKLDAHVREMMNWHFSPETGSPFWLDWQKSLEQSAALCKPGQEECLKENIAPVLMKRPEPSRPSQETTLASDGLWAEVKLWKV